MSNEVTSSETNESNNNTVEPTETTAAETLYGDGEKEAGEKSDETADSKDATSEKPEEKAEGEKAESDKDAQKSDEPGEYEEFKVPEGIELDKEAMEAFIPIAKELKLSQEDAQKIVDIHNKVIQDSQAQFTKAVEDMQDGWLSASLKDPEIGGDKFDGVVETVQNFFKGYNDPELNELLNQTGIVNHPSVLKFLHNVATASKEDNLSGGGNNVPAKEELSAAKTLFPNMN